MVMLVHLRLVYVMVQRRVCVYSMSKVSCQKNNKKIHAYIYVCVCVCVCEIMSAYTVSGS
jgi:hypothetical protein